MKFLKKQEANEPQQEEIKVLKVYNVTIQCLKCDEWSVMEGGPTGEGRAKFLCPLCHRVNDIAWNLDQ